MPRQIAPGNPPAIDVNLTNVKMPDFKELDALGDAKIKAANQNFKLYADTLIKTESAKLYEQYKNDPIQLSNALGKLPGMLKGLPEELQDEMKGQLTLTGIGLVQKAQNNMLVQQDLENERNAQSSIELSKELMAQEYQNILQNHISKAEDKNLVSNDVFIAQQMNLNNIADLTNHTGKNVYTEAQRKKIRNVDDLELEGFKQFFDTMLLNDNDELQQSKDYYTKFILAPDRFMAENYMNRATYEKAKAYAKTELTRAGADIRKAKFNQSIKEATELQIADLPGRIESLRESGQLDKSLIDNIEKVNVKFNELDPSKPETPTTMLEMLDIVNSWNRNPAATTEADKAAILAQGTAALDAIAEYGQTYGLSPRSAEKARRMIVTKEQDRAYGQMLDNFGRITQSFGTEIPNMRKKMNYIRGLNSGSLKEGEYEVPTDAELGKLVDLNEVLAQADDSSREALRKGDTQAYNQIQTQLTKAVAQIKYRGKITPTEWAVWEKDPDKVFNVQGVSFQIAGFTPEGDIITK